MKFSNSSNFFKLPFYFKRRRCDQKNENLFEPNFLKGDRAVVSTSYLTPLSASNIGQQLIIYKGICWVREQTGLITR